MKEKIIDFFNGIFSYDQPDLRTEPKELMFDLEPNESAEGSFVICSCDERRIKGLLHTRIPGMTLRQDSFFARAARIEYRYQPQNLRMGERMEGRIWLETSAGEYEYLVKVQIKDANQAEEEEEALPVLLAKEEELPVFRTGNGQSEEWKQKRQQEAAFAELQRVAERERTGACTGQEAIRKLRELADILTESDPESALYPLLNVWVMLLEERREEAGWILKKYEKTRLLKLREDTVRAVFLYVSSLAGKDDKSIAFAVSQLQKLYQKHPENWPVTAFLLRLDPQLQKNPRTRYQVMERLFRTGTRNRLLYLEAFFLLREDIALFNRLDPFTLQVFGRAAKLGLLTAETARAVALQATRLKKWTPLGAKLLKACYEIHPSKETAGAVCQLYIRGHRTDTEAFAWYERGVEWDAKITNLYEYFIYALPEHYEKLLPRQVLLYFHYHNTLTDRQRSRIYCNLVKYGTPGEAVFEEHRRLLQEFLLEQLRRRHVDETLAWLYGRCLLAETLEEELLEALADLLFLQKITCIDKRIHQVEVYHEQLEEPFRAVFTGESVYVPVYTEDAKILLIDEMGKTHQKTVPYERKQALREPGFLQLCTIRLENHLGLNLYLMDGKGRHRLTDENVSLAWKLLEEEQLRESYRQELKLELLDYERRRRRLEQIDSRLMFSDGEVLRLSRACQSSYIESLILLNKDEDALRILWKTGCREVDAGLLLRLLQRLLLDERFAKNLLRPLAWSVFGNGMYTEQIIGLLAEEGMGDTEELLRVWKAGEQFGMCFPELEERILMQALFTEQHVNEIFPVYVSMDDRGGESVLGGAYLNYLSWLEFVKGREVPEGLFDSLECHLLWEDRLSETAVLSWLKQLSLLLLQTDVQKRLAGKLLKSLPAKYRRFGFMQNLSCCMDDKGRPWDQTVVEYRCNPEHKVVLHYVLEYHGKKTYDYVTECLYPVCGGVFTRAFILFYGERLTWFFTETAEDGTEHSTECQTTENQTEHMEGDSRYIRLCRMQRALDYHQERVLKNMMTDYEELTELVEEQFHAR